MVGRDAQIMYGSSEDVLELQLVFRLHFSQGRIYDVEAADAAQRCVTLLRLKFILHLHFVRKWCYSQLIAVFAVTRPSSLSLLFLCESLRGRFPSLLLSFFEHFICGVKLSLGGRLELLCSGVEVLPQVGRFEFLLERTLHEYIIRGILYLYGQVVCLSLVKLICVLDLLPSVYAEDTYEYDS